MCKILLHYYDSTIVMLCMLNHYFVHCFVVGFSNAVIMCFLKVLITFIDIRGFMFIFTSN